MKRLITFSAALLMLVACTDKTVISGKITDASGQILYLEHTALSATEVLDSVKLNTKGTFRFKVETPCYPDFYRLRLGGENVVVALDSLSENVEVTASAHTLADAVILGSDDSKDIQRLRNSSFALQRLARRGMLEETVAALEEHKKMAQQIILNNTRSAAAYYAIYQTVNGAYFFSPTDKRDLPFWSAVATGYDLYYHEYDRSQQLKSTVLQALRAQRTESIDAEQLLANSQREGFVEIALPNRLGDVVKLSSLVGRVVLIDFSAYAMEGITAHTLFLRELYAKYSDRGFEIFQISVDADKLLWLEQTKNIPWVCVRDNNIPYSVSLATYNITEVPTFFLMNAEGDIVGRYTHANVEKAISELVR